ncbi:MAG: DUF7344 domain-containing protein [Halobacteriota archaeon]
MNEAPETVSEGRIDPDATNPDTTCASGGIESDLQPKAETTGDMNVDSTEPVARGGLPLDETFELLRNQRRRYVLQYLESQPGQVSLSELAEQIAAWENEKEIRQITSSERKRVYVGLYQCHLPKMDGMDVVSFNKPRGLIELGANADAVEPYLQRPATTNRLSGPRVGLPVIGLSLVPMAILLQSQSMLSLLAALVVIVVATLGGVGMLLRSGGDPDAATDGTAVT